MKNYKLYFCCSDGQLKTVTFASRQLEHAIRAGYQWLHEQHLVAYSLTAWDKKPVTGTYALAYSD